MSTRREVPVHPYQDVFKIQVLSAQGKWVEPERGKTFKARRYEKMADGTLKRIKRSFETLAEAKVFRQGSQPADDEIPVQQPALKIAAEEMTFAELWESWKRNWLPTIDLATQLRYRKYEKHFAFLMKVKAVEIDPAKVDAWIAYVKSPEYLAASNRNRVTYEYEFKVLRAVLNYYSSRCNRNYRDPFLRDHHKMLKVRERTIVKKDLTVDQFNLFLDALKPLCVGTKWESIYYLAAMQYAIYGRIQEAAALHVEDFDLANDRLEIIRKVQWLRVKGYESRIVAGSKANGGKIFSPIPTLAVQVFKEWKLRSGIREGLLFRVDGQLIEYRQIQYKYDHALKKAGLPFTATHILRHASLSEAYSVSADIRAVQTFAGHKGLRATERYAKVRDKQVAEVQRQMDERLSSVFQTK